MLPVAAPRIQIESTALVTALCCIAAGCNSGLSLTPPLQPETEAVLFIVESEGQITVEAIDPSQVWRTALTQQGDLQLTTLLYDTPLSALGLKEGMQALAEEGAPLPLHSGLLSGRLSGSTFEGWSELPALPPQLSLLRIEVPTPQECVSTGGCFEPREDGFLVCRATCELPSDLVMPPAPPAPPQLSECPSGWSQTEREGLVYCEPWPSGVEACPQGQVRILGESECAPLSPCPMGPWPEDLPPDAIYVLANAPAGGAGTLASPFSSLADALNAAQDNATIALSEGAHPAGVALNRPLTLVGACAERTSLTGNATATLSVTSTAVNVRDLQVSGGRQNILVSLQGVLHLDRVELDGATLTGLEIMGGEAIGARISIREPGAQGVELNSGRATLRGVTMAPVQAGGLRANGGVVNLEDIAILGSNARLNGGLQAAGSARLSVLRALIQNTIGTAVLAEDAESQVVLEDALIRNLVGNSSFGLYASSGGTVQAQRVAIDRAQRAGVVAVGGQIQIQDFIVLQTFPSEDGTGGWGLIFEERSTGTVQRGQLKLNRSFALLAQGEGTDFEVEDLLIEDTLSRADTMQDGSGVGVANSARMQLDRVRVLRARGIGFVVQSLGTRADARDLEVNDTLPREDGSFGRGLEISRAGFAQVTRGRFLNNRNISVFVVDEDSEGRFQDLHIGRTTESDRCISESCVAGIADGLVVNLFANANVERFLFEQNLQYGFRVINRSDLTLNSGLIRNNMSAGGLVAVEGFDLLQVTERVRYEGNVEALSSFQP